MGRRGSYSAATVHVWHQGRKVTPFAGNGYSSRYRYRWEDPQRVMQRHKEAQKLRWALYGPATRAQRTNYSSTVGSCEGFFRLLDAHGKPKGRRYTRLGPHDCDMHLVIDQNGNHEWLDGRLRVRCVTQQAEDLYSQASRIISRMHREACRDD